MLKIIMQGSGVVSDLVVIYDEVYDIVLYMLYFLENYDEQCIVSLDFVGDVDKGKFVLVVSVLISCVFILLYFG